MPGPEFRAANGIRPISQDALHVYDDLAYHAYGVRATQEECDALGRTCQDGSCVVLLNHGLLTFVDITHGALMRLYMLERTCELELMGRTMNGPIALIDDYVIAKAAERMNGSATPRAMASWNGRLWCARWNAKVPTSAADRKRARLSDR